MKEIDRRLVGKDEERKGSGKELDRKLVTKESERKGSGKDTDRFGNMRENDERKGSGKEGDRRGVMKDGVERKGSGKENERSRHSKAHHSRSKSDSVTGGIKSKCMNTQCLFDPLFPL